MPTMSYGEIWEAGLARVRALGREGDLELGAETQASARLTREYLDRIAFEMRLLDPVVANIRTSLFGLDLASPIVAAPLSFGRVLGLLAANGPQYGTGYLEPIAQGVKDAGALMGVGVAPSEQLQSVIDVGAPTYVIVKPYLERERVSYKLRDAEARGAVAVGIDIDVGFQVRTRYEPFGETYVSPMTVAELRDARSQTRLPFIVKGVLSVHDALMARAAGADAIVVCHHGGEIIDYAVPPLKVLPAIVAALDGTGMGVLVGSGLRSGTDIVKALALGAHAVLLGTPLMMGLAAAGAAGVRDLLLGLNDEVRRNLSILGCANPRAIDPAVLHFL